MLLTLFASVVIVFFILATRRTPRPYKPLERFTAGRIALGWTIEVAPDIDGPYRAAGDDWSGAAVYHGSSGGRVKGWVDSGTSKRTFNYPGRAGVSYVVVALENRDDEPTYLIFSKPDGKTSPASSGG